MINFEILYYALIESKITDNSCVILFLALFYSLSKKLVDFEFI